MKPNRNTLGVLALLNGVVEKSRFETSADGVTWTMNIANGSFAKIQINPLLQEVSFGRVVHDSISGANGILKGDARFDGQGHVVLDGTPGTYISLPGNLLAGLSNITVEAWITNAVSPDNVALFSFDDGSGNGVGDGYLRYVLHDQGNFRIFSNWLAVRAAICWPARPD